MQNVIKEIEVSPDLYRKIKVYKYLLSEGLEREDIRLILESSELARESAKIKTVIIRS